MTAEAAGDMDHLDGEALDALFFLSLEACEEHERLTDDEFASALRGLRDEERSLHCQQNPGCLERWNSLPGVTPIAEADADLSWAEIMTSVKENPVREFLFTDHPSGEPVFGEYTEDSVAFFESNEFPWQAGDRVHVFDAEYCGVFLVGATGEFLDLAEDPAFAEIVEEERSPQPDSLMRPLFAAAVLFRNRLHPNSVNPRESLCGTLLWDLLAFSEILRDKWELLHFLRSGSVPIRTTSSPLLAERPRPGTATVRARAPIPLKLAQPPSASDLRAYIQKHHPETTCVLNLASMGTLDLRRLCFGLELSQQLLQSEGAGALSTLRGGFALIVLSSLAPNLSVIRARLDAPCFRTAAQTLGELGHRARGALLEGLYAERVSSSLLREIHECFEDLTDQHAEATRPRFRLLPSHRQTERPTRKRSS